MQLLTVIGRALFFYFFILVIFRIMGKREVGQLSIQDLVVSILIAELVAISIENVKDSIFMTILPIIVLVILEIVAAFISLKANKLRNVMEGKPSLLINKGKINYKEMVRQRYSLDDLLVEIRSQQIKNLKDVEYAILENNGSLSIFKYNFLGLDSANPFPLILDGIIQKSTLEYIDKDEAWLMGILREQNLKKEEVFYAFYKGKKPFIIKKSDLISK